MANGEITVNVTGLDEYNELLKYAEEAAATCEEMKYDIEQVFKEIKQYKKNVVKSQYSDDSIPLQLVIASDNALSILENHLTKYLDLED